MAAGGSRRRRHIKILRRHGLRTRWDRLARIEGEALVARGLLTERTRRLALGQQGRHIEAERPGDLACLDSFQIGKLKGVGRLWQLTACDATASYGIAQVIRGAPRPVLAAQFLAERVLPAYGRAGRAVLTDQGIEWRGRLMSRAARRLSRIGGRSRGMPGPTRFVERLQRTILTECWRVVFRQTSFTRVEQLERALQRYLRFYNQERTHRGYRLQGRTPGSVFAERCP